jgi:tellurite resistance protein
LLPAENRVKKPAMAISSVDLTTVPPDKLRGALQALMQGASEALAGHMPSAAELQGGASATLSDSDANAAAQFQSMLEIGYLVASADGFADEERHALAELLSHVIGKTVTVDQLELHFKDLEDGVAMLGRHERLLRAAADFEDGLHRGQALGFAALVALADGTLAEPEAAVLSELGGLLGLSEGDASKAVGGVVDRVRQTLGAG